MTTDLFYPLLAHVALVSFLLLLTGFRAFRAVRAGKVTLDGIRDDNSRWPVARRRSANAYGNQFELPVLFYIVALLAIVLQRVDATLVTMAWAFVAARYAQALVHVTFNNVLIRFFFFLAGAMILFGMWLYLAVRLGALA